MPKECNHLNYKIQKQTREFQGEKFHIQLQVCQDCGAGLWNNLAEKKFNDWLKKIHSSKRHLFQIQYSISEWADSCIKKLGEHFPNVDESLLIRSLVIVYLSIVEENDAIMEKVENYMSTDDYEKLKSGKKISKKVQFKPNGMKDIMNYSNMFGIKMSLLVEESIYRILILSIREDKVMKTYWDNIVIKNIEIILKAA